MAILKKGPGIIRERKLFSNSETSKLLPFPLSPCQLTTTIASLQGKQASDKDIHSLKPPPVPWKLLFASKPLGDIFRSAPDTTLDFSGERPEMNHCHGRPSDASLYSVAGGTFPVLGSFLTALVRSESFFRPIKI